MRRGALRAGLAALAIAAAATAALAQGGPGNIAPRPLDPVTKRPVLLRDVRIDQKLDAQVPTHLAFKDELGNTVTLGSTASPEASDPAWTLSTAP